MYKPEQIAAYILNSTGSITTMKLQKLVYYAQALSLVKNNKPLFEEDFQAWANGPVLRSLYDKHKKLCLLPKGYFGGTPQLNSEDKQTVDTALSKLGSLSGDALSTLTHQELPWQSVRSGLSFKERSKSPISKECIAQYYSSPECTNPLFMQLC